MSAQGTPKLAGAGAQGVMSASYLIQILLPKETGNGKPIAQAWFEGLLNGLTDKFGGATSFVRAPGQGLWRSGGETQRDNIAVVEVMAERLDPVFWRCMRERLDKELSQKVIVIRAQEIIPR
jgi:hypothetical protein